MTPDEIQIVVLAELPDVPATTGRKPITDCTRDRRRRLNVPVPCHPKLYRLLLASASGYASTDKELVETTDWSRYGRERDPRCANRMAHCGYEPTAHQPGHPRPGAAAGPGQPSLGIPQDPP